MNEALIKKIKTFLLDKIDPDFIVLFGSQATGHTHPGSDVDVAFYKENHELSPYDIFIISIELAQLLRYEKVDLIDLHVVDDVFKSEIFGDGILIFAKDEDQFETYRRIALKKYLKLSEERLEIIHEILESGSVYG